MFSRLTKTAVLILTLLAPGVSFAAPTITNVSGTLTHGSAVTVTGSGFGTKSQAAPVVWDDATGTDLLTTGWDMAVPDSAANPDYNIQYRAVGYRGVSGPHSRSTKYIVGGHTDTWNAYAGGNVMFGKGTPNVTEGAVFYGRTYYRIDPNWQFGTIEADNNHKIFVWNIGGNGPYELPNDFYDNYSLASFNDCSSPPQHVLGTDFLQNPDNNGHSNWWNTAPNPCSGWVLYEYEVRKAEDSNGYIKVWANGSLLVDYSGRTSNAVSDYIAPAFGGYSSTYVLSPTENFRYFADVYMDWSSARILLGNASTYTASTIREVQIPSAWSDTALTLTTNLGQFTTGTAYLYVVDSTGAVNATGYPVTVGGAPDTTPPASPANLAVQ